MKVCVVGYDHPMDDKRVLSSVLTLAQENDVTYIYRSRDEENEDLKRALEHRGIRLIAIKKQGNGLFYRRSFDHELLKRCLQEDCDVVYTHGFAITAPLKFFKVIRSRGKKIIYDVHEYTPHNFLESFPFPKIAMRIKRKLVEQLFQKQLNLVDGVVAVSRLQLERILSLMGNSARPALLIPNAAAEKREILSFREREKVLTLVGKTPKYLKILESFAKEIHARRPDLNIEIIGIRSSLEIPGNTIKYKPFMSYEDMMSRLQRSLFGLVVYRTYKLDSLNDRWSLPNKFFDTLAAGTPVIVDNYFLEMANWVRELGIGVVIDVTEDPAGAAETVIQALNNKRYREFLINIEKHRSKFMASFYLSQLNDFVREIC